MFRPNSTTRAAEPAAHPLSPGESDALFSCFQNYDSLLIAVSGGSDSMALLALALEWWERTSKTVRLVAASVDHALRAGSAGECRFVARFCETRGIPHFVRAWEGTKPVTGIQNAARNARYDLLADIAIAQSCAAIVTAHTEDDQAETLLMRLARGSGLTGLRGMRPLSQKNGLPLLRPLLGVSRERLRASLAEKNITWCEDASNEDARYLRPRLRRLLPQLAQEGLDAPRLARFAKKITRADEALDMMAQQVFEHVRDGRMERTVYCNAPAEIRLRVLQKVATSLHASAYLPGDEQFEDLDAALMSGDTRRTLAGIVFSGGARYLRFSCENDPRQRKNHC